MTHTIYQHNKLSQTQNTLFFQITSLTEERNGLNQEKVNFVSQVADLNHQIQLKSSEIESIREQLEKEKVLCF